MPTLAESFYGSISSVLDLEQLIGRSEDATFDCKRWPNGKTETIRGMIAKAACSFCNAEGGVIVIGMNASGRGNAEPDMVQELLPVQNPHAAESEALEVILKFVEPGIEGVQSKVIPDHVPDSGFVLILIPAMNGSPRRTKTDRNFYVRVTSGTLPMEYFQIEDRFGRRPHPRLDVDLEVREVSSNFVNQTRRLIDVYVTNFGLGLARFPALSIAAEGGLSLVNPGVDSSPNVSFPFLTQHAGALLLRGDANDLLFARSSTAATRIKQVLRRCTPQDDTTPEGKTV